MVKMALQSLWARKLRALSTAVAVFLGIAFVAGTYVLTDTINAAFDEIFTESLGETDVVLSAEQAVTQETGETPTLPASVLADVRSVPGVEAAAGSIFTTGAFFGPEGDRIGTPFAPQFVSSVVPPRYESVTYVEGRRPRGAEEVAIDEATAGVAGLELGEELEISAAEPARSYRIVGVVSQGEVDFGGTGIAALTLPEAERVTDRTDRFDWVYAIAEEGVSQVELRDRIAAAVRGDVRVETEEAYAERQSSEIKEQFEFLRVALLVFAGIALLVGGFLILNTFSITVAQRLRELGLLRTLGASRAQLLLAVLAEAIAIGLLGSLAGLAGGLGVARGLTALFETVGADLPSTDTVLAARTVAICLGLGLGVTVLSALAPALRSTRVSPMAALQAGDIELPRRRPRLHTALAVLLAVAGLGALLFGLIGDAGGAGPTAGLMGGGAVAVVLAVSLFSSRLVRPLAAIAGAPLQRLGGVPGRLARENSRRKPGRTAITAAALMIGIAVVTFSAVFGAGLKATISDAIDESFQGDLVLTAGQFSTLPPSAAEAASEVPGVETVAALRYSQAEVSGAGREAFTGVDPSRAAEVLSLRWVEGSEAALEGLDRDQAAVGDDFAREAGVSVGDRFEALTQIGERPSFEVAAIFEDRAGIFGSAIVSKEVLAESFDARVDMIDFVGLAEGADAARVRDELERTLEEPFPTVEVLNQSELEQQQADTIDQLLYLVYALVLLAILVSLFGIANTLALSIHERIRELGMLRAVGMTRRQVRRMIRYEAVITATMGASMGMGLGLALAALISIPLAEEGLRMAYPLEILVAILVLSALAGVLSAVMPARRASRLDVLEAVSHE